MRLVDDLMEPFRPIVDVCVRRLMEAGQGELHAEARRELAILGTRSMPTPRGVSPISVVAQRLATSLAQVYESQAATLELPTTDRETMVALWDTPHDPQTDNEEAV